MRIRKNIAVSEEGFLFNPTTGDSFSTNSTGALIIRLLKQDKTLPEIASELCDEYDADRLLVERDLEEFASLLKEYSVLD
ncbi:MAG: PqqD family protein [Bacteroidales bacterium]|jgi:hypothetical protein|nr:PqqD family protein [Bacteroidales bacterium]OJX88988.1 MAG: hypothetical protein BGP01_00905 [Paludibacter sp. 47-17]